MTTKSNLVGLAKGTKKTTAAPKKPTPKVVEKPKTQEEVRDIKAKQKVEELLQSVELMPNKIVKEEAEVIIKGGEGIEWLEEQLSLQTEQIEVLKTELAQAKDDYTRLYQNQNKGSNSMLTETTNQNILLLFNELQGNLLGNNPEKTSWETVSVRHILNQLMQLFPFTENYRRF